MLKVLFVLFLMAVGFLLALLFTFSGRQGGNFTRKAKFRLFLSLFAVWFGLVLIGITCVLLLDREISRYVVMALLFAYGPIGALCINKVRQWDKGEKDRILAERLADPSYVPTPAEAHARHSHFRPNRDAPSDTVGNSQSDKD